MRLPGVLFALMLAGCGEGSAQPVWTEQATDQTRDGSRPWGNPMGDWVDAAGRPLGAKPFASASVVRVPKTAQTVQLDVTDLVRRHGADFRINAVDGLLRLASREAADGGPVLEVSGPGGTRTLGAVADTELKRGRKPLGEKPTLDPRYGVLIRFDQRPDPAIRRATLKLTAEKVFGRGARLVVFRPVVLDKAVTVERGAVFELAPVEEAKSSVTAAGLRPGAPPSAHRGGPGRVLLQVTAPEIRAKPGATVAGGALVGAFERDQATVVSERRTIPGSPESAYLTVVMKLAPDFVAPGGKFPGLANTGQGRAAVGECAVDGKPAGPAGWGGRSANGCRWSGRTWYRTLADRSVAGGTYFYAVDPRSVNGVTQVWSKPMPKGRWFAYVEWIKLNDPARNDGEVAYWLVDRQTAPGGAQVQSASGIRWRTIGGPASAINEMWIDVYCGGRDCGPMPWPRYEMRLKRLTVTTGLPDLAAIQAEVDRLNAGG